MTYYIFDHNASQADTVAYDTHDEAVYAAQAHKRLGRLRRWSIVNNKQLARMSNKSKWPVKIKPLR